MGSIIVKPITNTKKEIKKFVTFAWKIYKDNPFWVPPIISDQIHFITKGAYHEVGVIQPFLAYKDNKIVGRIIAHYDNRHNDYFNEKKGCFGFFECVNDKEISRALLNTAEQWLREQGMTEIHGPYNFLLYDASGLLLDDYENIPPIELNYNPPYYLELFEDYGLQKTTDWYAYLFTTSSVISPIFYKFRDQLKRKAEQGKDGLVLRNVNLKNYDQERDKIREVFNKAWEKNWGHYPLTQKQIEAFGKDLKQIAKEELIIMAEYNGELAGFILTIPDANIALQKANGRLFPFGLIKILLNLRKIKRIKTFMMGVLPEYRKRGLDVYFYVETFERAKRLGYTEADLSLIVETNTDMINALNHLGAKIYKTYRFYGKNL